MIQFNTEVAIIDGEGDFLSGDDFLAAVKAGATRFVEANESDEEGGCDSVSNARQAKRLKDNAAAQRQHKANHLATMPNNGYGLWRSR